MLRYVAAAALVAVALADTYCNYQITGEEILVEAVPIGTYSTSGNDTPRRSWCVAGCDSKTSVKGTLLLLPANATSPKYTMRRHVNIREKTIYREVLRQDTKEVVRQYTTPLHLDDDNTFCIDDQVAAMMDAVFDKYTTVDDITKGLNTTFNRPGWAYFVIEHVDDSVGEGANLKYDVNFCYKNYGKQLADGNFYFMDAVAMAVDDSRN